MSLTWTRLPERWHCQIQYENSNVHKIKKATNRRYRWRLLTSLSIKMPMDVWTSARALFPSEGKKNKWRKKNKSQHPLSERNLHNPSSGFRLQTPKTKRRNGHAVRRRDLHWAFMITAAIVQLTIPSTWMPILMRGCQITLTVLHTYLGSGSGSQPRVIVTRALKRDPSVTSIN